MVTVDCKQHCRPSRLLILFGLLLTGSISVAVYAQEMDDSCPCFSYEEVEGLFLSGAKLIASGGGGNCRVTDYGVEFTGEILVTDNDYRTVARASVDWADFDPGHCDYRDSDSEPTVERSENWPHPAPEAIARACLDIISSVIEKQDGTGRCKTYP